jgi:hypothetical protein
VQIKSPRPPYSSFSHRLTFQLRGALQHVDLSNLSNRLSNDLTKFTSTPDLRINKRIP